MIRSTPSWSTFAERLPWWAGSVTTVSKAQQREPRSAENYRGKGNLWVFNNVHRYFLYGSIVVVTFLWLEAIRAFFPAGFGLTIGSLVLLLNVVLLSGYTFGCHSMRHLVGARVDCYSCLRGGSVRRKAHHWVSALTGRHMSWAWVSLFSVWGQTCKYGCSCRAPPI